MLFRFCRAALIWHFARILARPQSLATGDYFTTDSTDDTDFFEQKGKNPPSLGLRRTGGTKEPEFFFVAFVCFCGNCFPKAARIENSRSVKPVKSVWLRSILWDVDGPGNKPIATQCPPWNDAADKQLPVLSQLPRTVSFWRACTYDSQWAKL